MSFRFRGSALIYKFRINQLKPPVPQQPHNLLDPDLFALDPSLKAKKIQGFLDWWCQGLKCRVFADPVMDGLSLPVEVAMLPAANVCRIVAPQMLIFSEKSQNC